ncbi:hypothetical protein [Fodinibius salsisoli]|uniref:histidine kinase n=1 Tax=Fodinibius salsisoli TaxID=2820877 RepID=A0ABT3PI23_9BACT|nr:hypothetical protein [Fodinibius salsisoli]MCW9705398.1 hypothetical protein [Fodinibius salsisoli]
MYKEGSSGRQGIEGWQIKKAEQSITQFSYPVSKPVINDTRYHCLREIHDLQKKMIRQNMHKAMSPISAISGYLELMKIFLQNDAKSSKIEHYRSRIEEGVDELGEIIEELHDVFDEEEENYTQIILDNRT